MARRTATPATPAPPPPPPPPPRDLVALADDDPQWAANILLLRRHWKWANFSQFFYTFADLLAMPDVFLAVSTPPNACFLHAIYAPPFPSSFNVPLQRPLTRSSPS